MKFRFLFLAIAILTCGTSALIADKTHAANAADACRAELERYCPNIEPGPRLGECMEQHQNELSSDCKKAHEQIKASGPMGGGAGYSCRADIQKYCTNMEPGPGLGECLEQHLNDLSSECKATHQQMKRRSHPGAQGR